jgi:hypothetical protein
MKMIQAPNASACGPRMRSASTSKRRSAKSAVFIDGGQRALQIERDATTRGRCLGILTALVV